MKYDSLNLPQRDISLELGERLALGYQFRIASSREQAIREAASHYEENIKMFGDLRLVRALTDEQIEAMRDPNLSQTADDRGRGKSRRLPRRAGRRTSSSK